MDERGVCSELLAPTLCQLIALAIVIEDLVRIKTLQEKKIPEIKIMRGACSDALEQAKLALLKKLQDKKIAEIKKMRVACSDALPAHCTRYCY
jgi:RNA polymerase-interacting CarD/CdnL/TRCF family regulator